MFDIMGAGFGKRNIFCHLGRFFYITLDFI